jgi:hypothetical protein
VLGGEGFCCTLLAALRDTRHRMLLVDIDPRVVEAPVAAGRSAMYGDAEGPALPAPYRVIFIAARLPGRAW